MNADRTDCGGEAYLLVVLANALCGWMFLKWVPRRGLGYAVSEKWFEMRNALYRNKRAKKSRWFKVEHETGVAI